jgi:hypothetical protein
MDKLLGHEGAEESDRHAILGEHGSNISITSGGNVLDLFPYVIRGGLLGHSSEDTILNQTIAHLTTGKI